LLKFRIREWIRRSGAVDRRTTRHAPRLHIRERIKQIIDWIKSTRGLGQLKVHGFEKVRAAFALALAGI